MISASYTIYKVMSGCKAEDALYVVSSNVIWCHRKSQFGSILSVEILLMEAVVVMLGETIRVRPRSKRLALWRLQSRA